MLFIGPTSFDSFVAGMGAKRGKNLGLSTNAHFPQEPWILSVTSLFFEEISNRTMEAKEIRDPMESSYAMSRTSSIIQTISVGSGEYVTAVEPVLECSA